ncbi:MAG TPA: FAD-dependent oxidoreductase [Pyrinomonadaceae bacterium]|nr:FAD-dependent oxidoreductase [Pyrinomonadaceae bacterium]
MSNSFNRRDFLRGAVAASALLVSARPAFSGAADVMRGEGAGSMRSEAVDAQRRFAPVKVSRDRIIREVVGLRPYRPSGFVVDAEKFGNKLLVHNYGHGGGGVTLSWGTASLAVDLARDFVTTNRARPQRFAVLGCGVSGLSTARLLQRRFQNGPGTVTIYAKHLPPDTTSNIAGASWSPTSVYEPDQVTGKWNDQFRQACQISNRAFQLLVGPEYGVRWIDTFELSRNEMSLQRELPGGDALYPARAIHRDPEHYFGFPFVRQYSTMLIEPSIYLNALLRDFYVAGGRVVVKEFRSRREIARLPETVVFNCTGLGSRELFDDEELIPVRGQLEVLLPQPEIDYCYLSSGYMFPRRDGIILGGTWDHGDWSLTPNAEQANGILEIHASIMKGLKSV